MSLLNVWLSGQSALVCVDSDAFVPGTGRRHEVSKFLPLAHANALLGMRGNWWVGAIVWQAFCLLDFDEMVALAAGPDFFKKSVKMVDAAGKGAPPGVVGGESSLVLVGYSRSARAMQAWAYDEASQFHPTEIRDRYVGPCDTSTEPYEEGSTVVDMHQLAQAQVRLFRAQWPDLACGGRLIVAEISPRRMMISDIGALG